MPMLRGFIAKTHFDLDQKPEATLTRTVRFVALLLFAQFLFFAGMEEGGYAIRAASAQQEPETSASKKAAGSGEGDLVIPPGQEPILAEMLGQGAELPDGCRLISGHVEYRVVQARYECPDGEVLFELVHPSLAEEAARRTDRFAITVQRGSPPASLVDMLEARIRAREADFEWQRIVSGAGGSGGPAGEHSFSWVRLAVVGLFVIGVIGWVVRKRGARKKAPA